MALYPNAADPGNWQSFLIREDVKSLSPEEQKKKYLTEQLQFEDFMAQQRYLQSMSLNSLTNQLHQGGNIAGNKVKEAVFTSQFPVDYNNTSTLKVDFFEPVQVVGGIPFIDVNNDQLGGGSASTARYTYYESTGLQMRFEFDLPASPNNSGTVAANVISEDTSLVGAITSNTLTGMTGANNVTNVTFTAAQGTGGAGFQDAITDVRTNGAGDGLDTLTFLTSASAATYSPGQTLTSTAGNIFDGTGAVTLTIDSNILTADTLSMVGTAVNLNGATVVNTGDGVTTDLTYTSTSTRGSIPD